MMYVPGQAPDDVFRRILRELEERYYETSHYKVKPKAKEVVALARTAVAEIANLRKRAESQGVKYDQKKVVTVWINQSALILQDDFISDDEKHCQLLHMIPFIDKEVSNIISILTWLREYVDAPGGVSVIELELIVVELNELLEDSTAITRRGLQA